MTKKQQRTQDDPEQSKRFIEAAKEAEADETEKGADRAFKKVTSKPFDAVENVSRLGLAIRLLPVG
jgi:hypothetical protein